jgi:hypothetical protein
VERASDIFFNNKVKRWMIRIIETGEILPASFLSREMAKKYEAIVLEGRLRDGELCV